MKKYLILTILLLSGCTQTQITPPTPPATPPISEGGPSIVEEEPKIPPHPVSIESLIEKQYNGSDLKLVRVLEENAAYTRHYITYKSGDLIISGIMNIPKTTPPAGGFPVLFLNHGHIDTSIYTNGRGLRREQDYLARQGYVVLHSDYRNHAQSGKDTRDTLAVRLAYAEDVINAVYAVKNSDIPNINTEKIGMLGHSMGGGITLATLVAQPQLVDAAVLYAPVSGDMSKSYDRWMSRRPVDAKEITDLYGSPTTSPEFWNNVSSENFYSRITAPVAIFHGTRDADVPLAWSEETKKLLEDAGKNVSLTIYPGAPHEFATDWGDFMKSADAFFRENLR
jgi:dipeptidyl aminopeptidase/acylaminoacyl peptidase